MVQGRHTHTHAMNGRSPLNVHRSVGEGCFSHGGGHHQRVINFGTPSASFWPPYQHAFGRRISGKTPHLAFYTGCTTCNCSASTAGSIARIARRQCLTKLARLHPTCQSTSSLSPIDRAITNQAMAVVRWERREVYWREVYWRREEHGNRALTVKKDELPDAPDTDIACPCRSD
jgi:hypothetical protein